MNDKIKRIEMLKGKKVKIFEEKFMIDYIYNSNALDGNSLTFEETLKVLRDNTPITSKPLKHHLSAMAQREACYYVNSIIDKNSIITKDEIFNIYKLVLMGKSHDGDFLNEGSIDNLLKKYKNMNEMSFIERITLFHLEFMIINIFKEENGKVARLILNLELMRNGYLPINIKFHDKDKYNKAIKYYKNDLDYSFMLDIICDNLLEEYCDVTF